MTPSDREQLMTSAQKMIAKQDACTHQFTFMGLSETKKTRFAADEYFNIICKSCSTRKHVSPWDLCPRCLNDLSKTTISLIKGEFQGSGPVDDGQTYGLSTLEKKCVCGITVWKHKQ